MGTAGGRIEASPVHAAAAVAGSQHRLLSRLNVGRESKAADSINSAWESAVECAIVADAADVAEEQLVHFPTVDKAPQCEHVAAG